MKRKNIVAFIILIFSAIGYLSAAPTSPDSLENRVIRDCLKHILLTAPHCGFAIHATILLTAPHCAPSSLVRGYWDFAPSGLLKESLKSYV